MASERPRGLAELLWPQRWLPTYAAWRRDRDAVTPVVGTILVLAITIFGITLVLNWGLPAIRQLQAETEVNAILEQFDTFDLVAESVMRGGSPGKASEATVNIPSGEIQRITGPYLIVTWFSNNTLVPNTDRYWVQGLDDAAPWNIDVYAAPGSTTADRIVTATRFDGAKTFETGSGSFAAGNPVSLSLASDEAGMHPYSFRITVTDGTADQKFAETWIFPLGNIEYRRSTPYGIVKVRLENTVVIHEQETGSFIRSAPLLTNETDAQGDPAFLAFFAMRYIANATFPGVEAGGSGTYPVLFSLRSNSLRVDGMETVSVALNMTGDRSELWLNYYRDTFGFVYDTPVFTPGRGVHHTATWDAANGWYDGYDLVLLESTVEVLLKVRLQDLGRGV